MRRPLWVAPALSGLRSSVESVNRTTCQISAFISYPWFSVCELLPISCLALVARIFLISCHSGKLKVMLPGLTTSSPSPVPDLHAAHPAVTSADVCVTWHVILRRCTAS